MLNPHEESAHQAWDCGDLTRAFSCFRLGALDGQRGCMMNLGYFYDEGLGTLRSKHQAMHWYKQAFRQGDACAGSSIAILYRERDADRKMLRWFMAAGRRGDGDAWVEAARCCVIGRGAPSSAAMAMACARQAIRSRLITPAGRKEAIGLLRARQ